MEVTASKKVTSYGVVASDDVVDETAEALRKNGFTVEIVDDLAAAKATVQRLIPKGAEVFNATSRTLDEAGIVTLIEESGDYDAVRPKMMALAADPTKAKERKQLTAAPEYVIGSAAAVTRDGNILVASATGSQLAPEAYGAEHVIYVVSTQKIVNDLADGIRRIKQHIVPLEEKRMKQAYGPEAHTTFSKLLVYNQDMQDRVQIILVKEAAGF